MNIGEGIYESLINRALQTKLERMPVEGYFIASEPIDRSEAAGLLAEYLKTLLATALKHLENSHKETSLARQITFCNQVIGYVERELQLSMQENLVEQQGKILRAILAKVGRTDEQLRAYLEKSLPISGLRTSSLFTGSNADLSIDTEIERDILSANHIAWIVSFIRWSGLRIFERSLRAFTDLPGASLRVITTTYMGASEPRALAFLASLPNTEIRVSYQTSIERLHAKAYLFERDSGYDTAYIGSSNLSRSALTKGLEWNLRVTGRENPHIIEKARATFEHHWNSIEFEDFRIGGIERFSEAIRLERNHPKGEASSIEGYLRLYPQPFQKEILERLRAERELHGRYRNLLVAATGTGKTVISAFDFKRHHDGAGGKASLLFVAHRKEILEQARATFRAVLGDRAFGELWVGGYRPEGMHLRHLFISVQSFNANRQLFAERCDRDYYSFIVVDEAHHSQADSYREIFTLFEPQVLLGLTATPERMDGRSLLPDFCNRIAADIRLSDALAMKLLTPFQYFCVDDESVDLRNVGWAKGAYDTAELSKILAVRHRATLIIKSLRHYLADPMRCRALCFCASSEHARFMSESFTAAGLRATTLLSGEPEEKRAGIRRQLLHGGLNYVFVVDIFNEGVDIPEIDTVLFLRPTESLTVFLQQLGRGLRLCEGKECLTVLDFVSQAHERFSFAERFRALVGPTNQHISAELAQGFPHLPAGCAIVLEPLATKIVLDNIGNAIFSLRRMRKEIAGFQRESGRALSLGAFLEHHQLDIRVIYSKGCWTALKIDSGVGESIGDEKLGKTLMAGMKRLVQIDSPSYLRFIMQLLQNGMNYDEGDSEERRFALMLYYDLFQKEIHAIGASSIQEALLRVRRCPPIMQEIAEVCGYLQEQLGHASEPVRLPMENVLELHARYSRDQILSALLKSTPEKRFPSKEGVVRLPELHAELLLVTLQKSDKDFSLETQYEDYAISETLFHWQTQNSAGPETMAGQSYINHRREGKTILLLVREHKRDAFGLTMPYHFLGPVSYQSHKGTKPMSIIWELAYPMPAFLWHAAAKMAVG